MNTKTATLLFLNAGRRIELIRCFQTAFENLGIRGRIVTTDINGLAPALYLGDAKYLLPRSRDPEFLELFCDLCRREHVDLIIPLIDPDLSVLAKHRDIILSTGAKVLISDEKVVDMCRDKEKTYNYLKKKGFPTPDIFSLKEVSQHNFPLFIKPKDGSASVNTFKINSLDELRFFEKYIKNPIIQEFIDGEEITIDVFSDWSGEPLLVVPRRRLKVRAGEVLVGRIERDSELEHLCRDIASNLGTVGLINIQAIRSKKKLYFIEINPRFGGGCPLSMAAGATIAEWILLMALNRPITRQFVELKDGLTMMRFDDSFFHPSEYLLE